MIWPRIVRTAITPALGVLLLGIAALACGDDDGEGTEPPALTNSVSGKLEFQMRAPTVVSNQVTLQAAESVAAVGMDVYVTDSQGNTLGKTNITATDGSFTVKLTRDLQTTDLLVVPALFSAKVGGKDKVLLAVLKPTKSGAPQQNMGLSAWAWQMSLSASKVGTVTITEAQGSGAVFIYLINLAAMGEMLSAVPASAHNKLASLAIMWAPGITWTCGACYGKAPQNIGTSGVSLSQSIFLGGASNESGAWGFSVLLHEHGHYVASNYSRDDSPGGSHYFGQPLDPAFAWSEGWATFFSASVMSVWTEQPFPLYWDIQKGSSFWVNLATAKHHKGTLKFPTTAGGMTQKLDENYVAAMIWHLWDGVEVKEPAGEDDGTALGSDKVLKAVMSDRFLNWNRGAKGADFVDLADAVLCDNKGLVTSMTKTIQTYLGFPYDGSPGCK